MGYHQMDVMYLALLSRIQRASGSNLDQRSCILAEILHCFHYVLKQMPGGGITTQNKQPKTKKWGLREAQQLVPC
jgi:hypothetical protein